MYNIVSELKIGKTMNAKIELLECLKSIPNKNLIIKNAIIKIDIGNDKEYNNLYKTINFLNEDDFFNQLSFINYDNDFGCQELYGYIIFNDGSWLERDAYIGSEWWEYKKTPNINNLSDNPYEWSDHPRW